MSSSRFEDRHLESSTSSRPKLQLYSQKAFSVITQSLLQRFIAHTRRTRISFIPKSIHLFVMLVSIHSDRACLENMIQKKQKLQRGYSSCRTRFILMIEKINSYFNYDAIGHIKKVVTREEINRQK